MLQSQAKVKVFSNSNHKKYGISGEKDFYLQIRSCFISREKRV